MTEDLQIGHNYDNLAAACARKLVEDGVCVDSARKEFELRRFSSGVCMWMTSQSFKKPTGGFIFEATCALLIFA
jgi:hypothetical protein